MTLCKTKNEKRNPAQSMCGDFFFSLFAQQEELKQDV